MANVTEQIQDVHIRLGRLEESIDRLHEPKDQSPLWMQGLTALAAIVAAYCGLGVPNHSYQFLFAILLIGWLYHRKTISEPLDLTRWLLVVFNVFTAAMVFKLLVGGGTPQPLSWVKVPVITGGLTEFSLSWQQIAISNFKVPLTVIQSYLLLLVFLGRFAGFMVFASLLAVLLVLFSIPALVTFNWDWVLPAVILFSLSIFFQSGSPTLSSDN